MSQVAISLHSASYNKSISVHHPIGTFKMVVRPFYFHLNICHITPYSRYKCQMFCMSGVSSLYTSVCGWAEWFFTTVANAYKTNANAYIVIPYTKVNGCLLQLIWFTSVDTICKELSNSFCRPLLFYKKKTHPKNVLPQNRAITFSQGKETILNTGTIHLFVNGPIKKIGNRAGFLKLLYMGVWPAHSSCAMQMRLIPAHARTLPFSCSRQRPSPPPFPLSSPTHTVMTNSVRYLLWLWWLRHLLWEAVLGRGRDTNL